MRAYRTPEEFHQRFWSRVSESTPDACWLWTGSLNNGGYGSVCSRIHGHYKAHRLSWEIHRGPIPEGMDVLHVCDVRNCVNPAHLFLGTHDENMADMREKGRRLNINAGSVVKNARLTESDIPIICMLSRIGCTHLEIAERYGVKEPCIWKIVNGQSWKHVPRELPDPDGSKDREADVWYAVDTAR